MTEQEFNERVGQLTANYNVAEVAELYNQSILWLTQGKCLSQDTLSNILVVCQLVKTEAN